MARPGVSGFIGFLSVAFLILGAGHYYVARRLVLDLGVPSPWREGAFLVLAALLVLLILQPLLHRRESRRGRTMAVVVYGWCGVWFMLVSWLGISDLLLWLFRAPLAMALPGDGVAPEVLSRYRALAVAALVAVLSAMAVKNAFRPPELTRVSLTLARWPRALDGFRIAQISDLHIGPILGRAFAATLTERANGARPDLTVITGDLADGDPHHLRDEVAPLRDLRAPHGVFFVTGNHDHYSDDMRWCGALEAMGIRTLRNERVAIGTGGEGFDLAGVDDHNEGLNGGDREAHRMALAGRNPERPVVLLAHDPMSTPLAVEHGVDLQLSGHTHGGQLWPFRYLVRLSTPFVAGLFRRGETAIYVNRGAGFWGPPMRLGAPAEITLITLKSG